MMDQAKWILTKTATAAGAGIDSFYCEDAPAMNDPDFFKEIAPEVNLSRFQLENCIHFFSGLLEEQRKKGS